MELTDWIVILAVALFAIAFYCRRAPARWSLENRARRFTATRLLVQAALSLWAAVLIWCAACSHWMACWACARRPTRLSWARSCWSRLAVTGRFAAASY